MCLSNRGIMISIENALNANTLISMQTYGICLWYGSTDIYSIRNPYKSNQTSTSRCAGCNRTRCQWRRKRTHERWWALWNVKPFLNLFASWDVSVQIVKKRKEIENNALFFGESGVCVRFKTRFRQNSVNVEVSFEKADVFLSTPLILSKKTQKKTQICFLFGWANAVHSDRHWPSHNCVRNSAYICMYKYFNRNVDEPFQKESWIHFCQKHSHKLKHDVLCRMPIKMCIAMTFVD